MNTVKKIIALRRANLHYIVLSLLGLSLWSSCTNGTIEERKENAVARVNQTYLYQEDLEDLVRPNSSTADSIAIVRTYIKSWATRQLFMDQAQENLTASETKELETLVEDYRNTLYTDAYKNAVLRKSVDLKVSDAELKAYYDKNSENFNLNEPLIQLRYLHLPPDYGDIAVTKEQFTRYTIEDRAALEAKKLEFISFSLTDSVWIRQDQVFQKIPGLREKGEDIFFRGRKNMSITTDLGMYLIHVHAVRAAHENVPLAYLKPTIQEIIRNQRKLELIKTLEKDITKDAIKNKKFELYEE